MSKSEDDEISSKLKKMLQKMERNPNCLQKVATGIYIATKSKTIVTISLGGKKKDELMAEFTRMDGLV